MSTAMRERPSLHLFAAIAVLALCAGGARAQQPIAPVPVEFRAGGDVVRGRFFPTATPSPLATVVLIPGFGGDTTDVLGLGARLAARDVNVLIFNNRGVQNSGGTLTYANALDDAAAALDWLLDSPVRARFNIDPLRVVLGGHSFGGSIAILHGARDTRVRRVLAIAAADHGTYARRLREEKGYREVLHAVLVDARAPQGTVRFDPDALIDDVVTREADYRHPPLAPRFVGRAVLLIGGWNDATCPIEREILPMYRALQAVGTDASIIGYLDGHSFRASRDRLADDVHAWLVRTMAPSRQP